LEEFFIAVAVGLALKGFDFVIHAFEWSRRDPAAIVVDQAVAMELEGASHLHQHRELRGFGPPTPVVEEPPGGRQAVLLPGV